MIPDASNNHRRSFLTQVPTAKLEDGVEVEKSSHDPLGFMSGTFRGSQQRWATVDKEGFAIVSTFRRFEYLLWGGVRILTDHRNLAYIFEPEACVSSMPKTAAPDSRIGRWCLRSMTIRSCIFLVSAIHGGSLFSVFNVPAVAVRAVAVFVSSTPDDTVSSKDAIREVQQQARAGSRAKVSGAFSFTTPVIGATKDNED